MRVVPPLLVVAALCLGGCATPAKGAADAGGVPTSSAVATLPAGDADPSGGPAPADATAPPSPSAGVGTGSAPATTATAPAPASGTAGLLAAAPVDPGPPLPPNPFDLGGPAPVGSFVLGDSISLSVGPTLARLGYPVMGVVGQSASEAYLRTNLATPTAQAAPAWVIVLGTNNTADPADVARLAGWVDLIDSLRSPGARQKVYWVTPHRPPSYLGSKSRWTLDDFNTELRRLDEEHGWLRIIDFDAVAKAHSEWFDQDTAMHLHPDSRGQGVLVALIAGPDAVPVEIPAPLFTGPPTPSPEPEPTTFVNSPRRPSATPTPTPSPMPSLTEPAISPPTPEPDITPSPEPAPASVAPSATPG
jgi:GDSL-like Lipase/Acylhydrolase family